MLQGKIPIAHENCYSLVYSILNNYKSLENIQAVALPKLRVCEILKMPVKLKFSKTICISLFVPPYVPYCQGLLISLRYKYFIYNKTKKSHRILQC